MRILSQDIDDFLASKGLSEGARAVLAGDQVGRLQAAGDRLNGLNEQKAILDAQIAAVETEIANLTEILTKLTEPEPEPEPPPADPAPVDGPVEEPSV